MRNRLKCSIRKIRSRKDVGWYLRSHLRILGTFPERSTFKVVVKKGGKELAVTRCEASIYQKATDHSLKNTGAAKRQGSEL